MVANGAPILARNALADRFAWPLDGGLRFGDGRPLFGPSKTLRGLIAALLATATAAPLLGHGWHTGLAVAALAMAGDLFSSFVKRRLGREVHGQALGLDQVPESLLPAAVLRQTFGLGWPEVVLLAVLFLVLSVVLSVVLYRWGIRDRPY